MATDTLFIEIDYAQRRKAGQNICGDAFHSQKLEEGRCISVLSDGLGSGVKANILSSMTARMALRFTASDLDFVRSAEIMMEALPVCQVRKISYATFSIVDCRPDSGARIIEMDNPAFMLVRNGGMESTKVMEIASRGGTRRLRFSEIATQPEDRIVLLSDGISQAGLGTRALPLGWREEGCQEYVLEQVGKTPTISARMLAQRVLNAAVAREASRQPKDDMTCGVLYFRKPRRLLLVSGPPFDKARDAEIASMLDTFKGRCVICGGTTANIIARQLHRPIMMDLERDCGDLPPTSHMEGADLITEGILTLTRVAQYLEAGEHRGGSDPASALMNLLLDSDILDFVVGSRINEAHQDPSLPNDIEIRRTIVRRIAHVLEEKHLKETSVRCI